MAIQISAQRKFFAFILAISSIATMTVAQTNSNEKGTPTRNAVLKQTAVLWLGERDLYSTQFQRPHFDQRALPFASSANLQSSTARSAAPTMAAPSISTNEIELALQRSAQLELRRRMSRNPDDLTIRDQIRKQQAEQRLNSQAKTATGTVSVSATPVPTDKYSYWSYTFDSYDYSNSMNQLVTTLYAPRSDAYQMQVDFNWIDMENGYDYVLLYDKYGLCAYYTGYYGSKISATCSGDWVDVYVETDGFRAGESYGGFSINGFYYTVDTYIPVAVAYADVYKTQIRNAIAFDGSYSYDYDSNISDFYWQFGDGYTSTSMYPYHSYAKPGNYKVYLTVTDADGNSSYDSFWVEIYDAPPSVNLTFPKGSVVSSVNDVVLAVAKGSGSGAISNGTIDWGDGTSQNTGSIATYKYFRHHYTQPQDYLIKVSVINTVNVSDFVTTVTVTGLPVPPRLVVDPKSLTAIGKLQHKSYSLSPVYIASDDGTLSTMTVNFGGNTIDSVQTFDASTSPYEGYATKKFKYIYKDGSKGGTAKLAGVFNVKAQVVDNEGAVTPAPVIVFATKNLLPGIAKAGYKKVALSCNFTTTCNIQFGPAVLPLSGAIGLFKDADGQVVSFGWDFTLADKVTPIASCGYTEGLNATCVLPNNLTDYWGRFRVTDNLGAVKYFYVKISKARINPKK